MVNFSNNKTFKKIKFKNKFHSIRPVTFTGAADIPVDAYFFQTVPVIIPESVGPWKGKRLISFTPASDSIPVICFSE